MVNENLESKRWWIAGAAVVIQLCLGTVYAWSVFIKPIAALHGWEVQVVSRVFMLIIGVIGISAAFGGTLKAKTQITEKSPQGVIFMNFHFAETAVNLLTNPALDPTGKIPEYKVCAVKLEAA